jgi:hypothetical protein
MMMELQKDEARDAPVKPAKLLQLLQDMYGAPPALSQVSHKLSARPLTARDSKSARGQQPAFSYYQKDDGT